MHTELLDFIAFPKKNSGKDRMIESPGSISDEQLGELGISFAPLK
jgi:aspartyl-tRNA synthetase